MYFCAFLLFWNDIKTTLKHKSHLVNDKSKLRKSTTITYYKYKTTFGTYPMTSQQSNVTTHFDIYRILGHAWLRTIVTYNENDKKSAEIMSLFPNVSLFFSVTVDVPIRV